MTITERHKAIIEAKICPYCGGGTKMMSELQIYGKTYKNRVMIACEDYPECDSYVGCHKNGMPLGRLANKNLREWKLRAHNAFDPIWKDKKMKRNDAYKWLSEQLGVPEEHTHIGMMSVNSCKKIVSICKQYMHDH